MIPVFFLTLIGLFVLAPLTDPDTELEPLPPFPDPCHVYASPNDMFINILVFISIRQLVFHPHLHLKAMSILLLTAFSIVCFSINTAARYMTTKIIKTRVLKHTLCADSNSKYEQGKSTAVGDISDEDTATEFTHGEDCTDEDIPRINTISRDIQIENAMEEITLNSFISVGHSGTETAPTAESFDTTQYMQDPAQPAPVVQASLHVSAVDAAVGVLLSSTDIEHIAPERHSSIALAFNTVVESTASEEPATPAPVVRASFFALTVDANGNSSIIGLPQSYVALSSTTSNSGGMSSPPYPIVRPEEANEFETFWSSCKSLFRYWEDKMCVDWANEVARELNHRRHMRNLQFSPITGDQRKWVMNALISASEDSERYALDHIEMVTGFSNMDQYYILMMQHAKTYPVDASNFPDKFRFLTGNS